MSTNASSTSRSTCALRGGDDVVLDAREHLAGVHLGVDAALEPPGDSGEHVLLAEAQHRQLVVGVEQPGLLVPVVAAGQHVADPLDQLVHVGPLDDRLDGQAGDEPDHAELVEVLEVAGVVGQQPLGDQLQQHVVVALERREHVGVGLERGEPVDREVARAAARLAALLDGAGGVPGAERLGAGRARLQLAPGVLVVCDAGEDVVQLADDDLLGEVQRVGPGEQREQPALVDAVVEEQLLLVVARWPRTGAARSAYWIAIVSATLAALMPAPPTQTRPWTSVPSMVKKRRLGLSMRLS